MSWWISVVVSYGLWGDYGCRLFKISDPYQTVILLQRLMVLFPKFWRNVFVSIVIPVVSMLVACRCEDVDSTWILRRKPKRVCIMSVGYSSIVFLFSLSRNYGIYTTRNKNWHSPFSLTKYRFYTIIAQNLRQRLKFSMYILIEVRQILSPVLYALMLSDKYRRADPLSCNYCTSYFPSPLQP